MERLNELVWEHCPDVLIVDNLGWAIDGDLEKPEDVKRLYGNLKSRRQSGPLAKGCILLQFVVVQEPLLRK